MSPLPCIVNEIFLGSRDRSQSDYMLFRLRQACESFDPDEPVSCGLLKDVVSGVHVLSFIAGETRHIPRLAIE